MFREESVNHFKEPELDLKGLVPACRAGRVNDVLYYVQAHTNDLYVTVPTEIYVYDKKAGARVQKVEMNLLTYVLLSADYDVFIRLITSLDDTNVESMRKFFDETIKAFKTASYALSFGMVLEHYKEAIASFKSFKDADNLAGIMACLPSYMLQAMCYPSWRSMMHFRGMTYERRSYSKRFVVQESKKEQIDINKVITVGKFRRIDAPLLCVYADRNECVAVDKKSDLKTVQALAKLDHDYIRLVLSAQMLKIYNEVMKVAIYMENNLQIKGSWLRFIALKERGKDYSEFLAKVYELFPDLGNNDKTKSIYFTTLGLINNKDQPIVKPVPIRPRSASMERAAKPVAPQAAQPDVQKNAEPEIVVYDANHPVFKPPVRMGCQWFGNPTAPVAPEGVQLHFTEQRPQPPLPPKRK